MQRKQRIVAFGFRDSATLSFFSLFMYMNRDARQRFAVIDIDPYGSPAPFLDASLQVPFNFKLITFNRFNNIHCFTIGDC